MKYYIFFYESENKLRDPTLYTITSVKMLYVAWLNYDFFKVG